MGVLTLGTIMRTLHVRTRQKGFHVYKKALWFQLPFPFTSVFPPVNTLHLSTQARCVWLVMSTQMATLSFSPNPFC